MMRFLLVIGLGVLLVLSCVSRTVPDTRFQDSKVLTAPQLGTAPSDPENFSFAFVGDTHIGEDVARLKRVLSAARAENSAFVILLGDIVDSGAREAFVAVKSALADHAYASMYLPVIGNHDIFNDGWQFYKEYFGPSHFVADYGNSRFIALDTADGTVDSTQYDWLKEELSKPKLKNTFFLSHYLPVIPGQRTYLKISNEEEALRLMKLAAIHEVRAWLGGHYHSFISETVDGVQYVVAGGAGGRRMDPIRDYFFVQATVSGTNVSYTLKRVD